MAQFYLSKQEMLRRKSVNECRQQKGKSREELGRDSCFILVTRMTDKHVVSYSCIHKQLSQFVSYVPSIPLRYSCVRMLT